MQLLEWSILKIEALLIGLKLVDNLGLQSVIFETGYLEFLQAIHVLERIYLLLEI